MNFLEKEQCTVLVIGGANVDVFAQSEAALVYHDSNPGQITVGCGGVGRNIAENLGRLGLNVELITVLGADVFAELIRQSCQVANVGLTHSLSVKSTSSAYLSVHDPQAEMLLAINSMQLINQLDAKYLTSCEAAISAADYLVLEANLSTKALDFIFSRFSAKQILADSVSTLKAARLQPYLSQINILKPNRAEAVLLSGLNDNATITDVIAALHNQGVGKIVISQGAEGVIASTGSEVQRFKAFSGRAQNVTGAGDALMAGLVYGTATGWNWNKTVRFGCAAAQITLSAPAAVNAEITVAKVLNVLQQAR